MKNKVGLFAYGETGLAAFKGLAKEFKIPWIICPPDQKNLPVIKEAQSRQVKVIITNTLEEIFDFIKKETPDFIVISSFNKILPEKILSLCKFLNVHHGDLPHFRGRANINWAIILGRKKIGLTFHEAISNLDAGNIYAQFMVPITNKDTVKTVYDKFNIVIEKNIATIVKKVLNGYKGKAQKGQATYCCTRLPEDGLIDWCKKSLEIDRLIRGLTKPYPGAFTYWRGEKLTIWDCELPKSPRIYEGSIPGRIVQIHKNYGVEVLTGDSSIVVKTVNYKDKDVNAAEIIKSVKETLGITIIDIYEKIINSILTGKEKNC